MTKLETLAKAQRILLLNMGTRALSGELAALPVDAELQQIIASLKANASR